MSRETEGIQKIAVIRLRRANFSRRAESPFLLPAAPAAFAPSYGEVEETNGCLAFIKVFFILQKNYHPKTAVRFIESVKKGRFNQLSGERVEKDFKLCHLTIFLLVDVSKRIILIKYIRLSIMLQKYRRVVLPLVFFFLFFMIPCMPDRIISASLEVVGIPLEVANSELFKEHFQSTLSSVADIPYNMINVGTAEPARSTRQVLSVQAKLLLEKTLRIPYTVSLSATVGDDEILTTTNPLYNLRMHDNDEEALKVQTYLSTSKIREEVKTRLGVLLQLPTTPTPITKSSNDVGNDALIDRMQQLRQQRLHDGTQIDLMVATPATTPTGQPSNQPSNQPSTEPTQQPSSQPSAQPVMCPSSQPSRYVCML